MLDPSKVQDDIAMLLESSFQLQYVNVSTLKRMRLQEQVNFATIYETPRNGKAGIGIIVDEAVASGRQTNISDCILDWTFPLIVIEQPQINFTAGQGTFQSVYIVAQLALDVMQLYADELYGTFNMESSAVTSDKDTESVLPGTVCKRVNLHLIGRNLQTPRLAALQLNIVDSTCTLSTATPGALITYTTDGTMPANSTQVNPSVNVYTAPFPAPSGTQIRAAAYLQGFNNPATRNKIAP